MKSKQRAAAGSAQTSHGIFESEIFIIDDDPMAIASMTYYLDSAGFNNTRGFGQPCEAIDTLRFVRPDVIITAAKLPDVSGTFLTKLIRTFGHLKEVPVIVATADSQPEILSAMRDAGADLVIPKRTDPDVLVQQITATLCQAKAKLDLPDRAGNSDLQQAQVSKELKQQESLLRSLCRPEST